MKKVLPSFFILILIFSIKSIAQQNYQPGYVIAINGDTIKGWIDYRNWKNNPKIIKFIHEKNANPVKYSPNSIKGFKVSDEVYISAAIKKEISSLEVKWLEDNPTLNLKADTVFLKTLYAGTKSLLVYSFKSKNNFYIVNNNKFKLLHYKKYIKNINGKKGYAENKNYLGQLSIYLQDYPQIKSDLKKIRYAKSDLMKVFRNYYDFYPNDLRYFKKEKKGNSKFGLKAGISSTYLDISRSNLDKLTPGNSIKISGAVYYELVLPWYLQKWSIVNELLISSYKFETTTEIFNNQSSISEIGYTYINLNNLVQFKYPFGPVYVFVNAGMSNGWVLKEAFHSKVVENESNEIISDTPLLRDTRKYEQGFILGTGIKYNDFSFELRLQKGNGMSYYENLNTISTRYFLLLGYAF
ncbi:MAG TPA: hypothetical protein ENK91_09265 [Bacteroidetes bacterium]|nr:hypothetical protein [Bacteroidota bacterium]